MTYYVLNTIKERLGIPSAITKYDAQLNNWGAQADSEVDDKIYDIVSKNPLITTLPILPLTGTAITDTIKNASNNRVIAYWYASKQRKELLDSFMKLSDDAISSYVLRKKDDAEIYGKVIH